MKRCLALAACLLATMAGVAAATELDAADQSRLGLRMVTLAAGEMPPTTHAVADVLDPAPLARALDELKAAQAAADASRAEVDRTRALLAEGGNASRKALEAARAQAVADRARLREARVALRGQWGDDLARMGATRRERLLDALVDGTQVLLKAEPLGRPGPALKVHAATLQMPDGTGMPARVLGTLPRSTSGLAAGWLLQADAGPLVPGMVLTAQLQGVGAPVHGVLLPRAAIVRWNGLDWAYVATGTTRFERRAVTPRAMTPAGWLVGAPFKPGERVVVQGAEALVAVDAAPAPGSAEATDD
jgi:multidrug efflux pump subunit AcrA (membrane-fusion protein)